MFRILELGDRISWVRFGVRRHGTVVRITRRPWAPGTGEVVALADEDAMLTSFDLIGGNYERVEGSETMASCHDRYVAHLRQFPTWVAFFEGGGTVGRDWGVFSGFTRVQAAL